MAKTHPPRLEPSTLNEWTLETNITNEIVNMFSDVFTDRYPYYFRRNLRLPFFNPFNLQNKRAFSEKLTPIEESKGGGWDTKISIPSGYFRDARALFIQYKKGVEVNGNNEISSCFNYKYCNPNPYLEFEFNNDTNNLQHSTLRKLKDQLAKNNKSKNSVMYAFPRITKREEFLNLRNSILHHTSFIGIEELDKMTPRGIDLGDNNPHHFRVDKKGNKKEVCSTIFEIQKPDLTYDFLYEVILLKLSRIWNEIYESNRNFNIYPEILLILAEYLKIEPKYYDKSIEAQGYLSKISRKFLKENYQNYSENLKNSQFDSGSYYELADKLYTNIDAFFKDKKNNKIDLIKDIPSLFSSPIVDDYEIMLNDIPSDFSVISIIL